MKPIRVFEHERLTIHEDEYGRALTQTQFEKLCQYNDKNDNKYFTVIRNGIKFGQYVGVIQIGTLTIEILPKADRDLVGKTEYESVSNKWQRVLMQMLAISGEIDLETISEASLRKRFTLLDLYFEIYLSEVGVLLRKGLSKKYRENSGNVKALKGRLNFSNNIQQNLIHQERFYTTHQEYDHEHLINQILLKGLSILSKLSSNQLLNDKINRMLFHFPEMHEITITKESFDKIRLSRKTNDYAKALKIAKMLILNYSPDISHGEDDMLALLFDMNRLWEKYIYKKLKAKEDECLKVSYHEQNNFWETRRIFPDIVIKYREDNKGDGSTFYWTTFVIDTKWKLVDPGNPSDEDLKQMYVYNMYWDSPKSMLLYPKTNGNDDSRFGTFHKGKETDNKCRLGFVSVIGEDGYLNNKIAEDVLHKIF